MPKLESVAISRGVINGSSSFPKGSHTSTFQGCSSLKCLVVPKLSGTSSFYFGSTPFCGCLSLRFLSVPLCYDLAGYSNPLQYTGISALYIYVTKKNMYAPLGQGAVGLMRWAYGTDSTATTSSANAAGYNYNLRTMDASNFFLSTMFSCASSTALEEIKLPGKVATLSTSAFSGCHSLKELDFSRGDITSVPSGAFTNCYNCLTYDFTGNTAIPTLSSTNAFTGINANAKIYVPSSLVTSWKAASNWSNYATYIVGVESVNIKDMNEVVVDTVKIETGGSWGAWVSSSFNKNGYHEEYSSVLGTNVIVNSAGTLVLGVDTAGMGPMVADPVFPSDTVNTNYNYYLVDTIPIN